MPWLVRKLISGKMDNGYFKLTKDVEDDYYNIALGTAKGVMNYRFQLNKEIIGKGYDGKNHKVGLMQL